MKTYVDQGDHQVVVARAGRPRPWATAWCSCGWSAKESGLTPGHATRRVSRTWAVHIRETAEAGDTMSAGQRWVEVPQDIVDDHIELPWPDVVDD